MLNKPLDSPKNCKGCGIEFKPKKYWQEFCCPRHQKTYYYSDQQLGAELVQAGQHLDMFKKILKQNLKEADEKGIEKQKKSKKRQEKAPEETGRASRSDISGVKAKVNGREIDVQPGRLEETWREWIDRNHNTEAEKKLFIEANMIVKDTFIDLDQRIGEGNDEFRARRSEESES